MIFSYAAQHSTSQHTHDSEPKNVSAEGSSMVAIGYGAYRQADASL